MVSGRYNDIFLQYITTLAIMVSAIICTCVHLSPPMLQITDEEVDALAGNQEVSLTSKLTDVYPKVQANILAGQERVRKRKLSLGQDDGFVVGDLVLRKNIRQEQKEGGQDRR